MTGFACDICQWSQTVVYGIESCPLHYYGAIQVMPQRKLDRPLADFPGFVLVNVGDTTKERALQITECVRPYPANFKFVFDFLQPMKVIYLL